MTKGSGLPDFDLLTSLASSFERKSLGFRSLAVVPYIALAFLAFMQLASPGAVGRIASQPLGLGLLTVLCALLLLSGVLALGEILLLRPRSALELGAADALLHLSVGSTALNFLYGEGLVSDSAAAVWVGGSGLATSGAGLYLAIAAMRMTLGERPDTEANTYRPREPGRGSRVLRGGIFVFLGTLQFSVAVETLADPPFFGQSGLLGPLLLAGLMLATATYALQVLLSLRQREPVWG